MPGGGRFDPSKHPRVLSGREGGRFTESGTKFDVRKALDSNTIGKHASEQVRKYGRIVRSARKHTREEKKALDTYTGVSFETNFWAINSALRTGKPVDKAVLKGMDSLTQSVTLTEDTIVYRGYNKGKGGVRPGRTVIDKGYVSLTMNYYKALEYATGGGEDKGTVAQLTLPKGTKVGIGEMQQHELILPRNTKIEISKEKPPRDPEGWVAVYRGVVLQDNLEIEHTRSTKVDKYGLTNEEQDVIWAWQSGEGEGNLNFQTLRESDQVTKILEKFPLHKGTVYRGVDLSADDIKRLSTPGTELTFSMHSSCSTARSLASMFTGKGPGESVIMELETKSGRKIPLMYAPTGEREVVIPKGAQFVVTKPARKRGGTTFVYLRESNVEADHLKHTAELHIRHTTAQDQSLEVLHVKVGPDVEENKAIEPLARAGFKVQKVADLPSDLVEQMNASSPNHISALHAIAGRGFVDALKDLDGTTLADIRDHVKDVGIAYADYEPHDAAMTTVTGRGQATFMINTSCDYAKTYTDEKEIGSYAARIGFEEYKRTGDLEKAAYAQARLSGAHEMLHLADAASGGFYTETFLHALAMEMGPDSSMEKMAKWLRTNLSPYALHSAKEATAEAFSKFIHEGKLPGLLNQWAQTILKERKHEIRARRKAA